MDDEESKERARENLLRMACQLVRLCELEGLVLTVEQRPLQPLAMGHYETVASIRPARGAL